MPSISRSYSVTNYFWAQPDNDFLHRNHSTSRIDIFIVLLTYLFFILLRIRGFFVFLLNHLLSYLIILMCPESRVYYFFLTENFH